MIDISISKEVQSALQGAKAVVALESTIISHGLPFPQNLETAIALEEIIREAGATPATIAIINGQIKVGLCEADLNILSDPKQAVEKISRRDLARVIQNRGHGATTVAATMIVAEKTGIKVFATGGIGGVHRGGNSTFDISADLQELARTNVCTVCAGPKAILDLPLTMEYLETLGVPVLGFKTDELPAFWSPYSGIHGIMPCATAAEIAAFLNIKWSFTLAGGVLVANPVPVADAIPQADMQGWIDEAQAYIKDNNVSGKDITPFMLDHIRTASHGRSLTANIALVKNNAKLAADIAAALTELD